MLSKQINKNHSLIERNFQKLSLSSNIRESEYLQKLQSGSNLITQEIGEFTWVLKKQGIMYNFSKNLKANYLGN